jgi:hypothetical protein
VFFEEDGSMKRGKKETRRPGSRSLRSALQCDDEGFVDFVRRCLIWLPEQRMTPTQALAHPWILGAPIESHVEAESEPGVEQEPELEPEAAVAKQVLGVGHSRSFIGLGAESGHQSNSATVSKVLTARQINDPESQSKKTLQCAGVPTKSLNKSSSWLLIQPSASAIATKEPKADHNFRAKALPQALPQALKLGTELATSPQVANAHKRQECLLLHIMSRNRADPKPSSQKRVAKQSSIC